MWPRGQPFILEPSEQPVQYSTVHRPAPQYPPGYNYGVDHLLLADGHPTLDEPATGETPALTDSQSEPFHSPIVEDFFTCISEPLHLSPQIQPPAEPQATCFPTREQPLINSDSVPNTKPHYQRSQIFHRGAFGRLKLVPRDTPAFASQNLQRWSAPSSL